MRVHVKGKNEKLSRKEIVYATKFFASLLMTERMNKSLTVHINYEDIGSCEGLIEFLDDNHRPKEFAISIKNTLPKRKQLITIAHEMVHVKQYARGELKYLFKNGQDKWQGTIVSRNVHYFDKPWEIDAYGRELGLYQRYINHKKVNKIKF